MKHFTVYFVAAALSVLNLCSKESINVVETPYDLQKELVLVQFLAPPGETNSMEYDSGFYLYLPAAESDPDVNLFSRGLVFRADESGNLIAPVSIFEDFSSRDTVYLNSANEVIFRIPPPLSGYNPFWVLEALYPDTTPPDEMLDKYDPARVRMKAILLPYTLDEISDGNGALRTPFDYDEPGKDLRNSSLPPKIRSSTAQVRVVPPAAGQSSTSTNRVTEVARTPNKLHHIYVDREKGSNDWDGKTEIRTSQSGPKMSIEEGLRSAGGKGRIFVSSGHYAGKVSIRGRMVNVHINGRVVMNRRAPLAPDPQGLPSRLKPVPQERPARPAPDPQPRPDRPAPDPQPRPDRPAPDPQPRPDRPAPAPQARPERPAPAPQARPDRPAPAPQARPDRPAPDPQARPDRPAPAPQLRPDRPAPAPQARPDRPAPAPQARPSRLEPAVQTNRTLRVSNYSD